MKFLMKNKLNFRKYWASNFTDFLKIFLEGFRNLFELKRGLKGD